MTQLPPSRSEGRILPFRPRGSLLMHNAPRITPAVPDLKRFENAGDDDDDDFRHRMLMNGLGLIVVVFLIAGGLWIADVMAQMRKNQDCVLSGRSSCTPIHAPLQSR